MQITGGLTITGGAINFNSNDPSFSSVSLLTSVGGNTATANTFVTSSPNSFSFNRTGNVAQGSFSPYGQTWSNYFDGTGDYLKSASSSVFAFGANDFTMEAWVFPITVAGTQGVVSTRISLSSGAGQSFFGIDAGKLLYFASGAIQSTASISAGQWSHIAATRSGTTIRVFLNGVQVATGTDGESKTTTFGYVAAGGGDNSQLFTGYVADARIINGTALYTANFTPPIGPLTATANTALLTCQSNRFVDNSPNNLAITRNGDVRITKESPYEPTTAPLYGPYGTAWSTTFDGSGDYLTLTGINLSSTNFTIEFWVNFASFSQTAPHIFNFGTDSNNRYNFWRNSSTGKFSFTTANSSTFDIKDCTTTPVVGVWYHVAIVSSSGTRKIYINGVQEATSTSAINGGTNWCLGFMQFGSASSDYLNGFISNFRVVTSAVYTANFTPPSEPLTPISGTTLLTCQSNRFIDASPNNFTITVNGNTTASTTSPFTLNDAYRSGLTGGSAYFSGTTDYLAANTTVYTVGNGNFTVECWAYPTTTQLQFFASASSTNQWAFGLNASNQLIFRPTSGTTDEIIGTSTVPLNTWSHFAVVRESTAANQTKIYLNGQLEKTGNGGGIPTTAVTLQVGTGRSAPSNLFAGYISDLRVANVAVYTANFAVPSSPLSLVSTTNANTFALLSSTNAGIFDSAGKNNLITYGDAQVATNVTKFGAGSMSFNGLVSTYLLTNNGPQFEFGNGNFTVECWVNFTTAPSNTVEYLLWHPVNHASGSKRLSIMFYANSVTIGYFGTNVAGTTLTWTTGQWYYLAFVRNGNTWTIYRDGISVSSGTDASTLVPASGYYTGSRINGYIEDLRITNGIARYTADFTPPTQPFPRC